MILPLLIFTQIAVSQGPLLSDSLLIKSGEEWSNDEQARVYKALQQGQSFEDVPTKPLLAMTQTLLSRGHVGMYCDIRREILARWQNTTLPRDKEASWGDLHGLLQDGIRRNSERIPRCHDLAIARKLLEYTEKNPVGMMKPALKLSLIFLRQNEPGLMKRVVGLIPSIYPGRRGPSHDNITSQIALHSAAVGLPADARRLAVRVRDGRQRSEVQKTINALVKAAKKRVLGSRKTTVDSMLRVYLAQENTQALVRLFRATGCEDQRVNDTIHGLHRLPELGELIATLMQCKPKGTNQDRLAAAQRVLSAWDPAATETMDQKVQAIHFGLQRRFLGAEQDPSDTAHCLAASIPASESEALWQVIDDAGKNGDHALLCRTLDRLPQESATKRELPVAMARCGRIERALRTTALLPEKARRSVYGEMARAVILSGVDKPVSTFPQFVQEALR
jgi:hypothetical protein